MDLSERLPGDVPVNLVMLIKKSLVIYPSIKPKLFAKKLWSCSKVAFGERQNILHGIHGISSFGATVSRVASVESGTKRGSTISVYIVVKT